MATGVPHADLLRRETHRHEQEAHMCNKKLQKHFIHFHLKESHEADAAVHMKITCCAGASHFDMTRHVKELQVVTANSSVMKEIDSDTSQKDSTRLVDAR